MNPISECVPDSANKRIWITSAYINKKGSKGQLLNIEDESSLQPTPEASFDSNATDTSISENSEKAIVSMKILQKNHQNAKMTRLTLPRNLPMRLKASRRPSTKKA